jgi:hypothetical protein
MEFWVQDSGVKIGSGGVMAASTRASRNRMNAEALFCKEQSAIAMRGKSARWRQGRGEGKGVGGNVHGTGYMCAKSPVSCVLGVPRRRDARRGPGRPPDVA